ncbi:MAG: hypothetical protein QM770_16880 [Tepidisphaeraceae bacterium]
MPRTFSHVDGKLAEAEFFLKEIKGCDHDFFAIRCFVSAFSSSARSVTFALQSCLTGVAGFEEWYKARQKALRDNKLARFFHEFRRINEHVGDNLVAGGRTVPGQEPKHWFLPSEDVPWVPDEDVATACHTYFLMVLSLVFDCYVDFGPEVDAQQRYTPEYFQTIGKTIEDAEEELGYPRGWTNIGKPELDAYRWELLRRRTPGCEINGLFEAYLGETTPCPEPLPQLELRAEDGWCDWPTGGKVWIPPEWRKTGDVVKDYDAYLDAAKRPGHNQTVQWTGAAGSMSVVFDDPESGPRH